MKIALKRGAVAALLLLAGCSSKGPCVNYLECEDGMSGCREQAHDTCPAGYRELQDSEVGSDFGDFAKEHFEGARSGVPHMVVICNP